MMNVSRLQAAVLGAVIAGSAFAQAPSSPIPAPLSSAAQRPAIASEAPIGPRDVIEIHVFQDAALNIRVTVGDDGMISMPPLGKIAVAGLTLSQIEQRIKSTLEARFLNKADVTVDLIQAGSTPISVIGAVSRPGPIGVTGNITLLQAITQAGGLAAGYGKSLYILRTAANGLTEQIAIDVDDLMVNGNPDVNIPLHANDVINVPIESLVTVYVLGEVMKPGQVQFRASQHPTLLQALAVAGGPTDRASRGILLKRSGASGETKTLTYNYGRVVDGREADAQLQDGDTIYIKASMF
jgi:polysaccharide export outer membrane protein